MSVLSLSASSGGGVIGQNALIQQALTYPFQTLLDVGAGAGAAALAFHGAGKTVSATGLNSAAYRTALFPEAIDFHEGVDICDMACFPAAAFDAVWCAHVIEHVANPGLALAELRRVLKPEGYLFLSAPPFKHAVVGGHVTPGWNIGILMYVLICAGFNVRDGAFVRHGNNITGFVRRGELPTQPLMHDRSDIDVLAGRFPPDLNIHQGFDGDLDFVNWVWRIPASERRISMKARIKRRLAKTLRRFL